MKKFCDMNQVEMFFPVWEKDESFAMFYICAEHYHLNNAQMQIAVGYMKSHGMTEKEGAHA